MIFQTKRLIVRKAEKSRICKEIIESLPNWFGIEFSNQEYIEKSAYTDFYVAYLSEKEIGFFSIISHFPQTSEIYICGILPDFHRQGIGRKLLQVIEEDLRKKKKKFLTVKTLSASHPDKGYAKTREFYKACGFVPVEEFKELWGKENPCLFLVKIL
jgi:ribosomal protein S18 acetylase RimI-like enzyme